MDYAAIKAAIYAWVSSAVGAVPVVWDEPEAPRPPLPSIRLSFTVAPSRIGVDELRPDESSADAFRIVGPRPFELGVTAYGNNAFQLISQIETSVSNPYAMALLQAANVSVLSNSPNRDVSANLKTKSETRAQMDFSMLTMENTLIQPGSIEATEVGADLYSDPADGDDPSDLNFSISADNGGV